MLGTVTNIMSLPSTNVICDTGVVPLALTVCFCNKARLDIATNSIYNLLADWLPVIVF